VTFSGRTLISGEDPQIGKGRRQGEIDRISVATEPLPESEKSRQDYQDEQDGRAPGSLFSLYLSAEICEICG
jgi:hypothetical protein